MPYAEGGDSSARNLVPACPTCNNEKNDHDPAGWMAAVGVPGWLAELLLDAHLDSRWRRPRDLAIPRTELDYDAGRRLARLSGASSPIAAAELGAPNCPNDLVPMRLAGDGEAAHWRCTECGLTKI